LPSVRNFAIPAAEKPQGATRFGDTGMALTHRRAWLACGATFALAAALCLDTSTAGNRKARPTAAKPAPAMVLRGTSAAPEPVPAAKSSVKPVSGWSPIDIAAARSECESLLKGQRLDFIYAAPVRNKSCGSAQPVEVRAIGKIAVQPPAIMNCRLAAKLAHWLTADVQPLARSEFKSDVVALKNEAAYDCRNRYNDPGQKLSEHATANALDIGAFTLANGTQHGVESNWGPVLRDVIKSAKAARPQKPGASFAATVTPAISSAMAAKKRMGSSAIRNAMRAEAEALGVALPAPQTAGGRFIHGVHASACKVFGTVLGPEANDAHREHFHVDLAPRTGSSYCE
jgi:hypothetical protein